MPRRALILNSQQHLYPHGGLAWVNKTVAATRWLKANEYRLILTTGAPTWEMLLYLAKVNSLSTDLFAHDPTLDVVELHQRMIKDADIILPVSIRPNGKLAELLRVFSNQAKVDNRFSVPYDNQPSLQQKYQLHDSKLHFPFDQNQYFYHWTRAARNGWSDLSRDEYFRHIIESESYPFTAIKTLERFLESRRIIASSRHMRRNCSVVSLTALDPGAMIDRMKWRKRYREMSFEPYGIGVLKSWAFEQGVRQVNYVQSQSRNRKTVDDSDAWHIQGAGRNQDWLTEQEYRANGDLLLPAQSPELVAVTYREGEAQALSNRFGILCGSFLCE